MSTIANIFPQSSDVERRGTLMAPSWDAPTININGGKQSAIGCKNVLRTQQQRFQGVLLLGLFLDLKNGVTAFSLEQTTRSRGLHIAQHLTSMCWIVQRRKRWHLRPAQRRAT